MQPDADFAVPPPPPERGRGPNYLLWGCAVLLVLGVLTIGSCAAFLLQGKRVIEPYGDAFFAAWDSEDYDALRAMIAATPADGQTSDTLVSAVRDLRDQLGPVKERGFRGFNINTSTEGSFAEATYHVQFASGEGDVTLSFVDENDVWMLSNVSIASDSVATERTCPNCGHVNPPGNNFCSECGRPLTPQPEAESSTVEI